MVSIKPPSGRYYAVAHEVHERIAGASDDPVGRPLVHLACSSCEAEVWWPAELAGERRCFTCDDELRPPSSEAALAASRDRPHGNDIDALHVAVELLAELTMGGNGRDPEQLRMVVDRARRAVVTLADVLTARDAHG